MAESVGVGQTSAALTMAERVTERRLLQIRAKQAVNDEQGACFGWNC